LNSNRFSREDRLFILATTLTQKQLTPDSNLYSGYIIGFSAANFSRNRDLATEDAETLTAAYRKDKWQGILGKPEETDTTEPAFTPQIFSPKPPTLKALENLLKKPCVPIQTIAAKHTIEEAEYTPKTQAQALLRLAEHDNFNGANRLSLAQARDELADKSLQLKDVVMLLRENLADAEIETRPGNWIYIYPCGRNARRGIRHIQPLASVFPMQPLIEQDDDSESLVG
jgi:hypothetical protein